MIKIIKASWILTCNKDFNIIKDGAIVFDNSIIEIGKIEYIETKYPNIDIEDLGANSVVMPGLINSHIHLEFSSNTTSLKYGNFLDWLHSVMNNREELVEKATPKLISSKLNSMLRSGTTTIGAISSYSLDLQACLNTKINTVFFCEVIGTKMDMIDTLFSDFKARLREVQKYKSSSFIPAVAIHSPYSVHPFLVRESLQLAREENLAVSSHFLESPQEFEWLHTNKGGFLKFFRTFLGQDKAVTTPMEFLNQFKNIENLSFTHCVEASHTDLKKIKELNASINHCVTSNRLLNNTILDINKLDIPITIGTDGLSSNNSLNMFDELRNCLMMHNNNEVNSFANKLLRASTANGAKSLGLHKGILEKNFDADILCIKLPDKVDENTLSTHIILHTKEVSNVYIGGINV